MKGYGQDSTGAVAQAKFHPAYEKGGGLFNRPFKMDTFGIPAKAPASEPFAFGDFSWLNGTSRKTTPALIDDKYFTSDITLDLNYTHSYNSPIDNTVVGSTALARDNELQLPGFWRRYPCGQCPGKDHDAVRHPGHRRTEE
jgi:hypothetical protein